MPDKIICHATCPFEFGKELANDFRNGSFCHIKSSLNLHLVAVTLRSNLWNSSIRKTCFSIEYIFAPVFFETRNPFHISMIERIVCGVCYDSDWQLHASLSGFYVWIVSQFCMRVLLLPHLTVSYFIVLRPVTRVRNGALGFGALIVGIATTEPFIDNFCNYIFSLLYTFLQPLQTTYRS